MEETRARKGETRQKILDKARWIFAHKGYEGASVDGIMKASGLSKGALYWHFRGKLDVYQEVMRHQIDALRERHTLLSRMNLHLTAKEMLDVVGVTLLEHIAEDDESRLLWLDLFVVAHRGDSRSRMLAKEIFNSLLESKSCSRNSLLMGKLGKPEEYTGDNEEKEWLSGIKIFFCDLLVSLGLTMSLDTAKKQWSSYLRMAFREKETAR